MGIVFGGRTMENQILEENVLKEVVRNIPFGVVVSREGLHRKVCYVNQTAYEIMGCTREEYVTLVEKGWSDFMDVDLREIIRENQKQIRNGEPFEVLSQTKIKKGENKWLLHRIVVRMQEGPTCYISFMDVTDRIEREQLRRREQEVLREQVSRDSFTKLLNRGTMELRVQEALTHTEKEEEYAYIALDVDDFKQINDAHGHGAGDMLILALARLLKETFGEESYVGRMGGDEFAVFVKDVKNRKTVCEMAECVRRGLRGERHALGLQKEPSVSIGIAFGPEAGTSFEELYHRADGALYRVKNQRKNGIAVCEF